MSCEMTCWVTPNDSVNFSCFGTSLQEVMPPIQIFEILFYTAMLVLDINITALDALKPLTTCFFTKSSLTVSTLEHSMSLRRSFLQMKAENQNFPQITRIWLKNRQLQSRIHLWWKHKFTNVVLSLCWQMPKLTVWYFWSASTYRCSHLSKTAEAKRAPSMLYKGNWGIVRHEVLWNTLFFHHNWTIWHICKWLLWSFLWPSSFSHLHSMRVHVLVSCVRQPVQTFSQNIYFLRSWLHYFHNDFRKFNSGKYIYYYCVALIFRLFKGILHKHSRSKSHTAIVSTETFRELWDRTFLPFTKQMTHFYGCLSFYMQNSNRISV